MSEKRRLYPLDQRSNDARIICNYLEEILIDKRVKTLHSYLPIKSEPDVTPFLKSCLDRNLVVVTSKTLENRQLSHWIVSDLDELETGIFGTPFPKNSSPYFGNYDLIIVPGLAFDLQGNRIGYGVGHYDVFLRKHPEAHKVGVGYNFQILENVPADIHDVRLDQIIYPGYTKE